MVVVVLLLLLLLPPSWRCGLDVLLVVVAVAVAFSLGAAAVGSMCSTLLLLGFD